MNIFSAFGFFLCVGLLFADCRKSNTNITNGGSGGTTGGISGGTTTAPVQETAFAFPGAEGFGKRTTGGRGGKVVEVTNLNDAGEGSLRLAVSGNAAKIVVFRVVGTIHLNSKLSIGANTTLAGQ
jgi:hypothetical protein